MKISFTESCVYFSHPSLAEKYSLDISSLGDHTMELDATKDGEKIEMHAEFEILKITLTYNDLTFFEHIMVQDNYIDNTDFIQECVCRLVHQVEDQ